jgi:hypothetical protein
MRRAFRHLFTLCSALSLLLCVAVCVLWVRSYRVQDFLWWEDCTAHGGGASTIQSLDVQSSCGVLFVGPHHAEWRFQDHDEVSGRRFRGSTSAQAQDRQCEWFPMRFDKLYWEEHTSYVDRTNAEIVFPHWAAAVVFTALPLIRVRRRLIDIRRKRAGLCVKCGYDLRAHNAGHRCPECGTAVKATS